MKKFIYLILFVFVITMFAACSKNENSPTDSSSKVENGSTGKPSKTESPSPKTENQEKKHIIGVSIPAPSVKNNLLQEPDKKEILIYLPPSYYDTDKNYPVLYYLHGYGGAAYEVMSFKDIADRLMKESKIKDMIIIGVNGQNKLGGSFYVNSPVTGNWEDHVVKDVVQYVDSNYRTVKTAEGRGIAGFSMGGFGSIHLGFRYPEVFSAVYALGPGLIEDNSLKKAFADWDQIFLESYGAAFSPNTKKESPYADIPKFDNSPEDNKIIENWKNGYANLKAKIQNYLKKEKKLNAIRIEYGVDDAYVWIPEGCRAFSKLLKESKVEHELKSFQGGHDLDYGIIEKSILPFFSEHLENE
ncbi:MAG: esterase family protein [Clostridia bacterium]|nr:esterase family protein [Clostridia bacterium]